jgi:hypothetical protein
MSLVDKLYSGQSLLTQKGKITKSNGRGGFGGASVNRYSIGMNSFNGKNGIDHFSRAMAGNISPNGLSNANSHYSDDDVEFDED